MRDRECRAFIPVFYHGRGPESSTGSSKRQTTAPEGEESPLTGEGGTATFAGIRRPLAWASGLPSIQGVVRQRAFVVEHVEHTPIKAKGRGPCTLHPLPPALHLAPPCSGPPCRKRVSHAATGGRADPPAGGRGASRRRRRPIGGASAAGGGGGRRRAAGPCKEQDPCHRARGPWNALPEGCQLARLLLRAGAPRVVDMQHSGETSEGQTPPASDGIYRSGRSDEPKSLWGENEWGWLFPRLWPPSAGPRRPETGCRSLPERTGPEPASGDRAPQGLSPRPCPLPPAETLHQTVPPFGRRPPPGSGNATRRARPSLPRPDGSRSSASATARRWAVCLGHGGLVLGVCLWYNRGSVVAGQLGLFPALPPPPTGRKATRGTTRRSR